jgi:hypothetical protein
VVANLGTKFLGSIKEFGAEVLKEADHFRKLGESIGMTVEDVAGFDRAAKLAGTSSDTLTMAMQGVANALNPEEASGQREALEKLGVSLRDANGLYVDQKEALLRISDAFAKETDTVKKSNIAREAFGKAGKDMIVLLNQGRESLEGQIKTYGDASGYSDGYARKVEELNDALTKAEISAKGALVAFSDSDLFKSAIEGISSLSDQWVKFLGELKTKKAIEESAALNNQMDKYADTVAKIESKKAKGKKEGIFENFNKDLDKAKKDLPEFEAGVARIIGLQKALNEAKDEGSKSKLSEELKKQAQENKRIRERMALDEKASADAAEAELKAKIAAQAKIDNKPKSDAAAKRYAEESKALDNWLANYQKSKLTETQIAQAAYDEQISKFNDLLTGQKISYDEFTKYIEAAEEDLNSKLSQIEDNASKSFFAEIEQKEKSSQEQLLRIKEAYAATDAQRDAIALERISRKYEEEMKLAKENGIALAEVERAKEAEIEAIKKAAIERDLQNEEFRRQLRETAAADEDERIAIQTERMNARYDAEVQKAKENAELIMEIERARIAEIERLENQLLQTRLNSASLYANSMTTIAKSMATLGKAGGNTMKAIAISEAMINTALAATKALATYPPPLGGIAAAAAVASGMAQVATIKSQKFADGGIVGGNSQYGDQVPVRANSGEMILNKTQQKKLFDTINGNSQGGEKQIVFNFAPNFSSDISSEGARKFLSENRSLFRSFMADEVSRGLSSAGALA